MDDVTFQRTELVNVMARYGIISDCVQQTVKDKGAKYLPMPNPTDDSAENVARYVAYKDRAVFYGVTGRTLNGMVGQVYARDPEITVPDLMKPVVEDATGSGLSLVQLSKDAMRDVVALGRGGLLTDYPAVSGATTRKQQLDGEIRPTYTWYSPQRIINWRTEQIGGKSVLTLVVLQEDIDKFAEFSVEKETQYRVLRLIDGIYHMQIYKRDAVVQQTGTAGAAKEPGYSRRSDVIPLDAKGWPFSKLPFSFIGASNNDASIDEPPLYDLAELNVAHYRNSADYEEASFMVGQPTPWFSGLTQDWVEDVFKGKVMLGSRAAVPLPENSQAGLLQVNANIMPMEAMKHKEAQMVALGARLVENRAVRRTYGEVKETNASETSILASCANNVNAAFTDALLWAQAFMGVTGTVSFKLNTEFALTSMAPEERNALIADMQAGAVSWTEVRYALRRAGVATEEDDKAKAEIEAWQKAAAEREVKPTPAAANKPPQK